MVAESLIEEARNFHQTFTVNRHPDTILLRHLTRDVERFVGDVVAGGAESALAVNAAFSAADVAAALSGEALTLPAFTKIVAIMAATDAGVYRVRLVEHEGYGQYSGLIARLLGRSLYLAQPEGFQDEMAAGLVSDLAAMTLWADVTALRVVYVPAPEPVEEAVDDVAVPDDARIYIVAGIARFMASRSADMATSDRRGLIEDADRDRESVLQRYYLRASNETSWYVTPE